MDMPDVIVFIVGDINTDAASANARNETRQKCIKTREQRKAPGFSKEFYISSLPLPLPATAAKSIAR